MLGFSLVAGEREKKKDHRRYSWTVDNYYCSCYINCHTNLSSDLISINWRDTAALPSFSQRVPSRILQWLIGLLGVSVILQPRGLSACTTLIDLMGTLTTCRFDRGLIGLQKVQLVQRITWVTIS